MLTPSPCGQRCALPTRAHDHRDHDRICRSFWTQLVAPTPTARADRREERARGCAALRRRRFAHLGRLEVSTGPGTVQGNRHMRLCRPAQLARASAQSELATSSRRQGGKRPASPGGQIGTGAGALRTSDLDPAGTPAAHAGQAGDDATACAAIEGDPGVRGGRTDAPAERRPDKGTAACGCPGLPPTPCSIAHGPIMRQWSHEHASSWTWRASLRPVRQAGDRQISARPYRVSARSRTSLPARTRA